MKKIIICMPLMSALEGVYANEATGTCAGAYTHCNGPSEINNQPVNYNCHGNTCSCDPVNSSAPVS